MRVCAYYSVDVIPFLRKLYFESGSCMPLAEANRGFVDFVLVQTPQEFQASRRDVTMEETVFKREGGT